MIGAQDGDIASWKALQGPSLPPGWSTRAQGRPRCCLDHHQRSGPQCGVHAVRGQADSGGRMSSGVHSAVQVRLIACPYSSHHSLSSSPYLHILLHKHAGVAKCGSALARGRSKVGGHLVLGAADVDADAATAACMGQQDLGALVMMHLWSYHISLVHWEAALACADSALPCPVRFSPVALSSTGRPTLRAYSSASSALLSSGDPASTGTCTDE